MTAWTPSAVASALAPGAWKIAIRAPGPPLNRPNESLVRAASSTRATSRTRTYEPSGSARTTTFSNSSGSVRRPLVSMLSWNWASPIGWAPMRPDRRLDVLPLERLGHVVRRQPQRGQPVGVDPDPHAVVERTEQVGVADAGHALDVVEDVDGGVVAQEQRVVAAVRRVDRQHLQDRRRLLLDGDALAADLLGQLRHGQGDAVLHVDRVDVGVGADLEADGQRVAAVVARGRLHVERLVDAHDLRLDRLRHGLLDHGGPGARVARGDLHLRRHDVGELRDRQRVHGDHAGQRDDDRDHQRQARAVDEGRGQHRGRSYSAAGHGGLRLTSASQRQG